MRHVKRPVLKKRFPVHVTWRMKKEVWQLRTHRCFRALARAFWGGCNRFGFRLIHYSVQGNHMHLLVEAADEKSLARGMNGLGVRVAKGLNKVMRRHGKVLDERYHGHILRTPTEVRNARALSRRERGAAPRRQGRGSVCVAPSAGAAGDVLDAAGVLGGVLGGDDEAEGAGGDFDADVGGGGEFFAVDLRGERLAGLLVEVELDRRDADRLSEWRTPTVARASAAAPLLSRCTIALETQSRLPRKGTTSKRPSSGRASGSKTQRPP